MNWWMAPAAVTVLVVGFAALIAFTPNTRPLDGLATPVAIVVAIVVSLAAWLAYFIIF